ncbi:TPA: glycosyltransferase family 2 protein [Streptococcus suis]
MLSIIIPVYNVEQYLKECLDSVLAQTISDKEIILVNDGSTDNSTAICQEYANKYDCIRYYSQENLGAAAARNTGIKEANGDYITFIDADDIYLSNDALKISLEQLEQSQADQIVFAMDIIYDKKNVVQSDVCSEILDKKEAIRRLLTNEFSVSVCNKIFKTILFQGTLFPTGMDAEDQLVSFETLQKSNKVLILDEVFYGYRRRLQSTTNTLRKGSLDVLTIKNDIFNKAVQEYPDFKKYYTRYISISVIGLKERLNSSEQVDPDVANKINLEYQHIFFKTIFDPYVTIKQKVKLVLVKLELSHKIKRMLRG